MTDWQKRKITGKQVHSNFDFISFDLDDYVENRERLGGSFIFLANSYPFNTYQEGDYIEIDFDKTGCKERGHIFDDSSIVRKFGSSELVYSGSSRQLSASQFQDIGNEMMNRAQQSGGRMEARFIARQEYRTDGSISAQEMGWVYRYNKQ